MIKENNQRIDKLTIDEAQERLDNFFEILLRADLRTLERLQSKKENKNKLLDNA
ncbi:MAG: hypothetical protein WC318_07270 [Candidatus Omnitrophota bacterium]|jgi:hypothetical protein